MERQREREENGKKTGRERRRREKERRCAEDDQPVSCTGEKEPVIQQMTE